MYIYTYIYHIDIYKLTASTSRATNSSYVYICILVYIHIYICIYTCVYIHINTIYIYELTASASSATSPSSCSPTPIFPGAMHQNQTHTQPTKWVVYPIKSAAAQRRTEVVVEGKRGGRGTGAKWEKSGVGGRRDNERVQWGQFCHLFSAMRRCEGWMVGGGWGEGRWLWGKTGG